MQGQLPRNLDEKLVDHEPTYRWLKSGDINGETESTILAAQDQASSTNYFFFLWRCGPTRATASSLLRFLDHTQRRITAGRTPLDE